MLSKIYKIVILFFLIHLSANLQSQDFNKFKDNLYWGGNFGLSFGYYTYIQIAPTISYAFNDDFLVGIGLDYKYFKESNWQTNQVVTGNIWQPKIFARYFYDNVFVHIEFQQIFYKYNSSFTPNSKYETMSKYYAGIGYRSWVGINSYLFIVALFDLESSEIVLGQNPFLQFGFVSGF